MRSVIDPKGRTMTDVDNVESQVEEVSGVFVDEAELDIFLDPAVQEGNAAPAPRRALNNSSAVSSALRVFRDRTGIGDNDAVPAARAGQRISNWATAGTLEALKGQRPNMPEQIADVVNWSGKKMDTKPVVKQIGGALLATDAHGNSRYAHALEIVSFAAALAPLYEPDHLASIIGAIVDLNVEAAYAPERYFGELHEAAAWAHENLLRFYKPSVQQHIWVSLWSQAHSIAWWQGIEGQVVRRRRARRTTEADRDNLVFKIVSGALEPSMDLLDQVADMELSRDDLRLFHQLASMPEPNANAQVIASHIANLPPTYRPRTPVVSLLQTMVNGWKRYAETSDTPFKTVMPKDPADFATLCSADGHIPYPIDTRVVRLFHKKPLKVAGRDTEMRVLLTPTELKANGTHMGNCTFTRNNSCQAGTRMLGHFFWADTEYNFEVYVGATLTVGEVNSRFNRGVTHPEAKAAIEAFIAEANRLVR